MQIEEIHTLKCVDGTVKLSREGSSIFNSKDDLTQSAVMADVIGLTEPDVLRVLTQHAPDGVDVGAALEHIRRVYGAAPMHPLHRKDNNNLPPHDNDEAHARWFTQSTPAPFRPSPFALRPTVARQHLEVA